MAPPDTTFLAQPSSTVPLTFNGRQLLSPSVDEPYHVPTNFPTIYVRNVYQEAPTPLLGHGFDGRLFFKKRDYNVNYTPVV